MHHVKMYLVAENRIERLIEFGLMTASECSSNDEKHLIADGCVRFFGLGPNKIKIGLKQGSQSPFVTKS